jgi:hypothetical protein
MDMTQFIAPRSDQLNADDLIGGPRTITVSRVRASEGTPEQPVEIHIEGSDKPYKPCKSMRRVMVSLWGADASQYVGRSMTLYRDPEVQFGGMKVGGIRIGEMSHIEKDAQLVLTASKTKRAPYIVKKMKAQVSQPITETTTDAPAVNAERIKAATSVDMLNAIWKASAQTRRDYPEHVEALKQLAGDRKAELQTETEEAF